MTELQNQLNDVLTARIYSIASEFSLGDIEVAIKILKKEKKNKLKELIKNQAKTKKSMLCLYPLEIALDKLIEHNESANTNSERVNIKPYSLKIFAIFKGLTQAKCTDHKLARVALEVIIKNQSIIDAHNKKYKFSGGHNKYISCYQEWKKFAQSQELKIKKTKQKRRYEHSFSMRNGQIIPGEEKEKIKDNLKKKYGTSNYKLSTSEKYYQLIMHEAFAMMAYNESSKVKNNRVQINIHSLKLWIKLHQKISIRSEIISKFIKDHHKKVFDHNKEYCSTLHTFNRKSSYFQNNLIKIKPN